MRRQSLSVLSGLLSLAVEDELITTNVARGVRRRRQSSARVAEARTAKAMTREQRDRFLEVAQAQDPVMCTAACVSPVYVRQQAGHAAFGLTVRVYGSWLPAPQPGALEALAEGAPLDQPAASRASTGNRRGRGSRQQGAATGT